MPKIILHQWEVSPFCNKVRKILKYKHLAYSVVNYNGLLAVAASRLSSAGKLPVIEYDGEKVQDSSDIGEFLEARHPQHSLYPADSKDLAQAYFWEDWADESLYWFEVYFRFRYPDALQLATSLLCKGRSKFEQVIFAPLARYTYERQLNAQGIGRIDKNRVEKKFFTHIGNLETIFSQQDWLVGNHQTIADLAVAAQIDEILRTSPLKERILSYSHVKSWLERIQS